MAIPASAHFASCSPPPALPGVPEMPTAPIVDYLARDLSAFYALGRKKPPHDDLIPLIRAGVERRERQGVPAGSRAT